MNIKKRQLVFSNLMRVLQVLLGLAGWLSAGLILGMHLRSEFQPFLAVVFASGLGFIALVVHEGGHYLGARLQGMPVLMMRFAAFEVKVGRQDWQIRWSPQPKGSQLGGYVMAATNRKLPLRQQMLWLVLMGPVANFLTGLASGALAWITEGLMSATFLAFAMLNLSMALANLVPSSRMLPSDGTLLIALWLHRDDQGADLAQMRLLAMSMEGVACEQLPDTDITLLSQGSMPHPLISISYRLTALLNQSDFQAATQLESKLDALLQEHAHSLKGMSPLITLLRIEFAFARAFLERGAGKLWDDWANIDIDWYCPWLRPRCAALRAFLHGDLKLGESYVRQALAAASNSMVASTKSSEARLADSMRALFVVSHSKDLEPELVA